MKNAGIEVINQEGVVQIKVKDQGVGMVNERCREVNSFEIHSEVWVVDGNTVERCPTLNSFKNPNGLQQK